MKKAAIIFTIMILAGIGGFALHRYFNGGIPGSNNNSPQSLTRTDSITGSLNSPASGSADNPAGAGPQTPEQCATVTATGAAVPVSASSSPALVPFSPAPRASIAEIITLDVPFTSQAPFGDWKDPRQQDGCEEASSLMAMLWTKGQKAMTPDYALSKILDISKYEEDNYGGYHDTGAVETLDRIIKGYFKYQKAGVRLNISLADIKDELAAGNLVIAPMDGQTLGNPNYAAPGPERHMIVIKGYDPAKKQFITNDPGTRKGDGYRYDENIFYNSIRDYPCGNHEPITANEKNIIVIRPEK